jgi:hypothetical protein
MLLSSIEELLEFKLFCEEMLGCWIAVSSGRYRYEFHLVDLLFTPYSCLVHGKPANSLDGGGKRKLDDAKKEDMDYGFGCAYGRRNWRGYCGMF